MRFAFAGSRSGSSRARRLRTCSIIGIALAVVCIVSAFGPSAHAVPPSPHLLDSAKKDPVLTKQLDALQESMRSKGIDAPAKKQSVKVAEAGTTGQLKTLAILVDFSDQPAQVSASFFDDLLFANVYGPSSLRGYYREVSYGTPSSGGLLDVVTLNQPSSVGWVRLPHTLAYYADDNYGTDGTYPHNAQKMVEDAVAAVDSMVDFSAYDGDGDGYVDNLFVIHAGQGAEYTGEPGDIWSHMWETETYPLVDGVRVRSYSTEPEYWEEPGDMTVGVYAHEMGHVLGLPDLYDRDYSSAGAGEWSLMAFGSWNGATGTGEEPARFDAWCATELGWAIPTAVAGTPTARSVPTAGSSRTGTVFQVYPEGVTSGPEYFLVENRQQTGTDASLPGSGLLVWHVDESVTEQNDDENHKLVDLEQACGTQYLDDGWEYDYSGGPGDPYPGSTDNRAFSDLTTPNAFKYGFGGPSGVEVSSISDSGDVMQAVIGTSPVSAWPPGVSSVDPSNGPDTGGRTVTIDGFGFADATAVTFDGIEADFTVDSYTRITATAPEHAAGTVDVRVTTPIDTSANTSADDFTYVAASALTIDGSMVGGDISPEGDSDWFQFTVSTAGNYTIYTAEDTLVDSYMCLYGPDSANDLIAEDDDGGAGMMSEITKTLAPGVYLVELKGFSDTETGTYTVGVKTFNPSTLTIDGPSVGGDISPKGDIDWFRFTVSSMGIYRIDATAGTITDADMILFGPDDMDAFVKYDDGSGAGWMPRMTHLLEPGDYYVRMQGSSDDQTGTYSVDVKTVATSVPALTIDAPPVGGDVSPEGDADWLQFTVSTAGEYLIEATAGTLEFGYLSLYGPDSPGALLAYGDFNTEGWMSRITGWLEPGTYYAQVEGFGGGSGPAIDTGTYSIRVENLKPSVTALNPTTGLTTGGTSVTITGTNFFDVTEVAFGTEVVDSSDYTVDSDTQITATAPAQAAGTVQVKVTTVGGESEDTAIDDFTYVARYDDKDSKVTYAPAWSRWDGSGYWAASDDTYAYTDKKGDKAIVTFEGTSLDLIACTSNTKGKAKVTLDPGTPGEATQTVDLYSPATKWKQKVYSTGVLVSGTHTVVIECLYEKRAASGWYTVDVDRIDIVGTLLQSPIVTKIDDNVTDAAADAYFTYSPGIAAGASTSQWSRWDNSNYWAAYQDTYAYTDKVGFKTTFTFTGTYAAWVAATSNAKGKALVTVDGKTAEAKTVDLYSPTTLWKQKVYDTGILAPGTHTVVIECLYKKRAASAWYTIDVDRFDVILTP